MPGFVTLDNGKTIYREHTPSATPNSSRDSEQVYYGNIARIGRMKEMRKENPNSYTEQEISKEIALAAEKYDMDPVDYTAEIDLYIESQKSESSIETNEPQM